MRIERLKSGKAYAKVLDKAESEVANVINKYFNSTIFEENASQSREAMINEITKRIEPLILNLAQTIAYKEIQSYVTNELGTYIDGKILELMANIKQISIKHVTETVSIDAASSTSVVMLPSTLSVDISKDVLTVLVNGQEQIFSTNYQLIMDSTTPTLVTGVNFEVNEGNTDILEVGDTVTFDALIYKSV